MGSAKKQHAREGAAHVFTSWRQETPDPYELGDVVVNSSIRVVAGNVVQDNTIDAGRAAEILGGLEGAYLLKIKLVKEQEEGVFVVEDAFQPLRAGRTRGQAVIEITAQTNPGVLKGIDRSLLRERLPDVSCRIRALPHQRARPGQPRPHARGRPQLRRPGGPKPPRERDPGHNGSPACENSELGGGIHEAGATLQDLARLESATRRAIIVRDIAGEILHSSGRYGARQVETDRDHTPQRPRLGTGAGITPGPRSPDLRQRRLGSDPGGGCQ